MYETIISSDYLIRSLGEIGIEIGYLTASIFQRWYLSVLTAHCN